MSRPSRGPGRRGGRSRFPFRTAEARPLALGVAILAAVVSSMPLIATSASARASGAVIAGPTPLPRTGDLVPGRSAVPPVGGAAVIATVAVGSRPQGLACDGGNGEVYVANLASDNVSVISDSTHAVVATIPLNGSPYGVVYDPGKGEIFVTNGDNVSVISDGTNRVIATIPVGLGPRGIAYDAGQGELFVANTGSNYNSGSTASVISDTTNSVVATVPVGSQPYDAVYDSGMGEVFVTNYYSANLTVISDATTQGVAAVPQVLAPRGGAYDGQRGELLVTSGANVTIVSDATNRAIGTVGVGTTPRAVAYDVGRAAFFVTNEGSANVSVIDAATRRVLASVAVGSDPRAAAYDPGRSEMYVANYLSDNVSILTDGASSAAYTVRFNESGLPSGTAWTVTLGGSQQTSTSNRTLFVEPNGSYAFAVTAADPRYRASPSNSTVTVAGAPAGVAVTFTLSVYPVVFAETGLPNGTSWYLNATAQPPVVASSTMVTLAWPNGTYPYSLASSDKRFQPTPTASTVVVSGGPVSVALRFEAVTYPLAFRESGLPPGTGWQVTVGGASRNSWTTTVLFNETNGSYDYLVGSPAGFAASAQPPPPIALRGGPTNVSVIFTPFLRVNFTEGNLFEGSCRPFTVVVHLTANATGGSAPYAFTWSFGPAAPLAHGPAIAHTYTSWGTFPVTVWAVDAAGANGSVTRDVFAPAPPGCPSSPWFAPPDLALGVALGGATVGAVVAAAVGWRHRSNPVRRRERRIPSRETRSGP
jgi:YVTN family beta-propeller protein